MSRIQQMSLHTPKQKQYQSQSYLKNMSLENRSLQTMNKNINAFQSSGNENMIMKQTSSLQINSRQIRLNVVNKINQSQRISIIVQSSISISQLKRKIQNEFYELHNKSILIKVIEDSKGFIFSNNSLIGDHVQTNNTIYIVMHTQKQGKNMNLSSNLTDIFLTLRFVSRSVMKKLYEVRKNLSVRQILSQLISFGFWYSNSEIVFDFLKLINQILTKEEVMILDKGSGQILDGLILKFLNFWIFQIPNGQQLYPDLFEQILIFIEKLTINSYYCGIFKNTKITKKITELSKSNVGFTKICLNIVRNINGKNRHTSAPNNLKMQYMPTVFTDSNVDCYTVEEALQMLADKTDQTNQVTAIETFAENRNNICFEVTVRFDYYWKILNSLFSSRIILDKKYLKYFAVIIDNLNKNTSETRAVQLLDKNILKVIHNFLLQSPVQLHSFVTRFSSNIINLAAKNGQLNIKKVCELFSSPYQQFQIILCQGLQINNDFHMQKGKGFSLMYINNIKDFIRMALKTSNNSISKPLVKILSNLCLDEQCRYQILNLKGIQIFVKLLQTNKQNSDIQRACAKGLLNLAISSRETKVKVLAQMTNVIEYYYKRQIDSIASGYIQTILKSSKI